jgi:hypothetical protein
MDFIEGFFKSEGKEVVFVVVDKFSKYVHFIALHHPYKTTYMAKYFMDNVFKIYGFPTTIVSDREPIFLSQFWQNLLNK